MSEIDLDFKRELLGKMFVNIGKRILSGKCILSEEQVDYLTKEAASALDTQVSKAALCDMLKISRSTFDDRVSKGIYPEGEHRRGFKEKVWRKSDFIQ